MRTVVNIKNKRTVFETERIITEWIGKAGLKMEGDYFKKGSELISAKCFSFSVTDESVHLEAWISQSVIPGTKPQEMDLTDGLSGIGAKKAFRKEFDELLGKLN